MIFETVWSEPESTDKYGWPVTRRVPVLQRESMREPFKAQPSRRGAKADSPFRVGTKAAWNQFGQSRVAV